MYLLNVLNYRFITHSIAYPLLCFLIPHPLHKTLIHPNSCHKKKAQDFGKHAEISLNVIINGILWHIHLFNKALPCT